MRQMRGKMKERRGWKRHEGDRGDDEEKIKGRRGEGGVDVGLRGSLLCELGEVSIEGFLRKRERLEATHHSGAKISCEV